LSIANDPSSPKRTESTPSDCTTRTKVRADRHEMTPSTPACSPSLFLGPISSALCVFEFRLASVLPRVQRSARTGVRHPRPSVTKNKRQILETVLCRLRSPKGASFKLRRVQSYYAFPFRNERIVQDRTTPQRDRPDHVILPPCEAVCRKRHAGSRRRASTAAAWCCALTEGVGSAAF
jgi:hypothetical protein